MTKAESIAQAFIAALTSPEMTSVPAANVYRDYTSALDAGVSPAIVVDMGDETPPDGTTGFRSRTLTMRVMVLTKGANPKSLADPVLIEAHGRIMADSTLAGLVLDVRESATTRRADRLEKPVAYVTKEYDVDYRTTGDSLEE